MLPHQIPWRAQFPSAVLSVQCLDESFREADGYFVDYGENVTVVCKISSLPEKVTWGPMNDHNFVTTSQPNERTMVNVTTSFTWTCSAQLENNLGSGSRTIEITVCRSDGQFQAVQFSGSESEGT